MVQAVMAVEGFPPAFLLHQHPQALGFQAIAVPVLPEGIVEAGSALPLFEGGKLVEGALEVTGLKQSQSLFAQFAPPGLQPLFIRLGAFF